MKKYQIFPVLFFLIAIVTLFVSCSSTSKVKTAKKAFVTISGTIQDTSVSGTATFVQAYGKVKMILDLYIPSKANSSVAVHLHEMGDCGNMGKDAHGHWNPTNQSHGKWGSASFHLGDIGNVALDAQGHGKMELVTSLWSIGDNANNSILGRSVIVHSGTDDYVSQPAGNAGSRIGCGVIQ